MLEIDERNEEETREKNSEETAFYDNELLQFSFYTWISPIAILQDRNIDA